MMDSQRCLKLLTINRTLFLLILLFADDVAMLSDTVVGLQRQLNVLQNYCTDSGLTVNSDKLKL